MDYIFMDNFRGFSKTFVPLQQVTFLVGENSTGKSSFLALLYLLSNPQFLTTLNFSTQNVCDLGGFKDIVSVNSKHKTSFTFGILSTYPSDDTENPVYKCSFAFWTFRNDNGLPRLWKFLELNDTDLWEMIFYKNSLKYKLTELKFDTLDEYTLLNKIMTIYAKHKSIDTGFTRLPKKFAFHHSVAGTVALLKPFSTPINIDDFAIFPRVEFNFQNTWFGPIRTEPKRIYGGLNQDFNPVGSHTPHILRSTLRSKEKAIKFSSILKRFGDHSGLFKSVNIHSFSKELDSPFEVLIELGDSLLNISNVGYGVSQILPFVVEILSKPSYFWFAIQQPEVHLHPKAQAALGEIIHYLAIERNHHYVIETHSDYLIDRFRLGMKNHHGKPRTQIVYFERTATGNRVTPLNLNDKGQYPENQPKSFRKFFISEAMRLLDI